MPVLAAVVMATLVACGSPSVPASSDGPGSQDPGGSVIASTAPAASSGVSAAFDSAQLTSVGEIAAAENTLADQVALAAGLPATLGAENWAWANKLLHDELAKAGQRLTVKGDAGLMAALHGGPPLAAVEGGAGLGLAMAASMMSLAISNPSGPTAGLNGAVTSTQTTTTNGERTSATVTFGMGVSASGSTVEGDVEIGIDVTVADAATGTVLRTASFTSRGKIKLDFCPDANGKVRGHVTMNISGGTSAAGSASLTVDADVEGTVGDDAYLNQVAMTGSSSQSTTAPGGGPARSTRVSGSFTAPVNRSGTMNAGLANSVGQVDEGPDDLTDDEVNAAYRQIGEAAGTAVWLLGDTAQAKWRNGACVEIRATEQSRDVRKNETVQFEAKVFHKIEGVELNKPIVNDFTGTKSVDPVDIPVPAPVTISFKAGPMADDIGTITMTTTSNRGIGTLAIRFRVQGGWVIDQASGGGRVKGLKCGDPDGEWIVDGTYKLAGFEGVQRWTITINPDKATGKFTYNTTQVGQPAGAPVTIYLVGLSSGNVTLSIDPSSGMAHMHLSETKHTYVATTSKGGQGNDQNAPLVSYDFNWDVGGTC